MHTDSVLVVGGGPTAAAAAVALSKRGRSVTVLEPGLRLEPQRERARSRSARTLPNEWSSIDLEQTRFRDSGDRGVAYKRLFGSDVAFRNDGVGRIDVSAGVGAAASHAYGGLTSVWGAGMLPYTDSDMTGWPFPASDLAEHYSAVLEFVPYSVEDDELSRRYPPLVPNARSLLRSDGAEAILRRLRRHKSRLESAGFTFGGARLAVRVGSPAPERGCVYCRHCLDGCPYSHIYSAAFTLDDLRERGAIRYAGGFHVRHVEDRGNHVVVWAAPLAGGSDEEFAGRRLFLAAGAVETTAILQRSGYLPDEVSLLDSQTASLPFLWLGGMGETGRAAGYTLAELFVVLDDRRVSQHAIHLSLYTHNDSIRERAVALRPRLVPLLGSNFERLSRRLVFGICFLHSDDSHRMLSVLDRKVGSIRLEANERPAVSATISRFGSALLQGLGRVGLIPLLPLTQVSSPGGGYHYGGSIPMRSQPADAECDVFGRPGGVGRVHVVDSSCFPTIPGGTITFPAMANSHRIAAWAAEEDS